MKFASVSYLHAYTLDSCVNLGLNT